MKIQQGREEINSNGGNILIGALLRLNYWDKISQMTTERIKHGEISHGDILKIAAGLLAQGRNDFGDIDLYRDDPLFKEALGLRKIPSSATLRQRLNDLGLCNEGQTLIDGCVVELLRKVSDFGTIRTQHGQYIPMDIDVSVMLQPDNKKEGVGWTYHNAAGYAPIFCHLGTHGYMLANELREGSQHSAKGAVEFLNRCFGLAKQIGLELDKLLVRVDSGHDDKAFVGALCASGARFLVKRNLRSECREQYLALARRVGIKQPSREGKNIYRCVLSHRKPEGLENEPIFMVVEVIERLTDAKTNQKFLIPELEVSTWWTNLPEDEATCIELYHAHGTSEQFHSELKSDMGLERLPSGKFTTNALILNLVTNCKTCSIVTRANNSKSTILPPTAVTTARAHANFSPSSKSTTTLPHAARKNLPLNSKTKNFAPFTNAAVRPNRVSPQSDRTAYRRRQTFYRTTYAMQGFRIQKTPCRMGRAHP